jgi:SAM-dependent methyltransferase
MSYSPQNKNFLVRFSRILSDPLLDNPFLFNYVRFFLAGKQIGMKKFISEYLQKYDCKTVIDFCCGTGDFAECCGKNVDYLGVDNNPDFITHSKNRYKGKRHRKFTIVDVLKPEEMYRKKYDGVLLISAIHHFSDEELDFLLPRIKKITKKVLIIADIIPDPPHPIQKIIVKFDRGRYVRPKEEKLKILRKYFRIKHTRLIPTQTAVQFGIICEVKK